MLKNYLYTLKYLASKRLLFGSEQLIYYKLVMHVPCRANFIIILKKTLFREAGY